MYWCYGAQYVCLVHKIEMHSNCIYVWNEYINEYIEKDDEKGYSVAAYTCGAM